MQFSDIYSWCTSLGNCLTNGGENSEFTDYYTEYFNETSICSTILWCGLGIAAILAALFYFGVCNFVFNLSKRWVWLLVLVLTFAIATFATMKIVCGYYAEDEEQSTGIFKTAYIVESNKLDETTDPDAREEITAIANDFRKQFVSENEDSESLSSLPLELGITNGVYAIVGFIILSIIAKRFTKHGSSIPF